MDEFNDIVVAYPLPAAAPKKSNNQCLKVVDFLINDILMVLFSMCDIVLDILVCMKFYADDQMAFFYVSTAIFLFARKPSHSKFNLL